MTYKDQKVFTQNLCIKDIYGTFYCGFDVSLFTF